jgi:2-iminobutanoate/2-iminopropanoate deaminase
MARKVANNSEGIMSRQAINDVPGLGKTLGPYSRAVWAGDLLYLSGQTGVDPATGKLAEGGTRPETEQALKGLSAVLKAAGLSAKDVVKANVYLIDMHDFATMNMVYESFFETPRPARTTVAVAALPGGARVEIEFIARRGD